MLDGNLGSLLYGYVSVMASLFSHMQNVGFLMTWLIIFSAVKCTNRRGQMTNLNKVAISHNCILSPIHVRNLHTGANFANLHLGYIFGHVNGVLRICTRVQIYSHLGANLHPGANCAHKRKCLISIYFDREF